MEMGEERSPAQLAWREAELQAESKAEVEVTARLHTTSNTAVPATIHNTCSGN